MTYAPSNTLTETSLQELYGDDYANDFVEHNRRYVADLIISNVAGMNFREVKHDYAVLFGNSAKLPSKWFNHVKSNIEKMNPSLIVNEIIDYDALPRILDEEQITYFKLIDLHRKKLYILFITPYILDAL